MSPNANQPSPYWRKTLRLSGAVLAVWLLFTLAVGLFGRSMDFRLFGWPFGFWLTAQASLFVFCVLVWVYVIMMDRIDRDCGSSAGD